MNRRNDPVEELVDGAREAVHAEDFERAIALLREANQIAPMRQDIRQFLGAILEGTSVGPDEPVSYREARLPRDVADPPANAVSASDDSPKVSFTKHGNCLNSEAVHEDASTSFPRPSWLRARPRVAAQSSDEPQADDTAVEEDNVLKISLARKLAETPNEETKSQDGDAEPFVPYCEMRGLSDQATEEPDEKNRDDRAPGRGKKRRGRNRSSVDTPDETGPGAAIEADGTEAWNQRFPSPSPRVLVFAAVYTCIALFLITASVVTHRRFFGKSQRNARTDPSPVDKRGAAEAARGSVDRTEEEIIRLASDYFQNERFDDCIALLSHAVKSGGATATRQRMSGLLASAYEAKGTKQLLSNQIAESAESYVKAVDLSPDNPDYTLRLGNAYYYCATNLGNSSASSYYGRALKMLNRTVELDPRNLQAYELLASVYVGLEKTSQAQAALVKIVEIAPSSDQADLARRKLKTLTMAE